MAQAPLTVTADDQSATYGSALPALTASYTGLVNGDTAASLTTPPTCTTTATASSPAGTYPITCTGAVDTNYAITDAAGTLTIGRAPLTVTADDQTLHLRVAADRPDRVVHRVRQRGHRGLADEPPTCATPATSASPTGPYLITCTGAVDPNYDITDAAGTLTVGPAPLTVIADNQTSAYGRALPTLTASYTGLVNGDTGSSLTTPPTCSTAATSASPAGPYAIACSGAVDPNYAITYVTGTLTIGTPSLRSPPTTSPPPTDRPCRP